MIGRRKITPAQGACRAITPDRRRDTIVKMNMLLYEELKQRKVRLATSILVVLLATSVIVSVQSISRSSRRAVIKQIQSIGANTFVLPRSLSMVAYYSADFGRSGMPESYFYKLAGSGLVKRENVQAKLCSRIAIDGQQPILTGVLPFFRNEDVTGEQDVILGNTIAELLNKQQGDKLTIGSKTFSIGQVLPEKGTSDDIRIFASLGTVQKFLERGRTINAIEITSEHTDGLAGHIEILLPDTRVVTKNKIARVQENTIRAMNKYSVLLLAVVLVAGAISIANYMSMNVRDRRKEIGTLLAIGATPRMILVLFLKKAALLGLAGGLIGYMLGTFLAILLGPQIVGVPVRPAVDWCVWAVIIAVVFSVASSYLPAHRAARLDPAVILQDK